VEAGKLDPHIQSPEPVRSAHVHVGECSGAVTATMVILQRDELDGGWISRCAGRTSTTRYWWSPDEWDKDQHGDAVKVTRRANILLVYETARPAQRRESRADQVRRQLTAQSGTKSPNG
jgi:hypothetical protein